MTRPFDLFKQLPFFISSFVLLNHISIGYGDNHRSAEGDTYIGCFIDGGPGKRLMDGFQQNFPSTLTPDICKDLCFEKGFVYSGTQNRNECYCSRSKPPEDRKSQDNQCDMKCVGDNNKYCGGFNRLSVHRTGISEDSMPADADFKYIGCFREHANGTRLMSGYHQNFQNILTNQLCLKLCWKKGFKYAGMQYGLECYCDNTIIYQNFVNDDECNMKCEGNNAEICGGNFRISLYYTGIQGSSMPDTDVGKYLGCYKDFLHDRQLNNYMKHYGNELTIFRCVGLCFSMGHLYAGTQNRACYCGEKHPDPNLKVEESECSKPCSGELNRTCGGENRNSIYETGIQDIPEKNYLGCFNDFNNQILNGFKRPFKNTNSPRRCFNICRKLGFKYSGVEFSEECFCGKEAPPPYLSVSESECNLTCSGYPGETCGAALRQRVYYIDIEPSDLAAASYVGCYIDGGPGKRLLNGIQQNSNVPLTLHLCNSLCSEKGFLYTGTANRNECYCSKMKPPEDKKADDSQCNMKCAGDISKYCGGDNRISVHRTGIKDDSTGADLKYIGCFNEFTSGPRLLSGYRHEVQKTLTNQLCVNICKVRGFSYAGTQAGWECFCDNKIPSYQHYANDEDCNMTCSGDNLQKCGGIWKISVFHTDIPGSSGETNAGKYIGCYKDQENQRHLNKHVKHFGSALTLLKCTGLCYSMGFLYAGTQNSEECYCRDEPPNADFKLEEKECSKPCSGEKSKMCGGNYRNSIHATGITDISEKDNYIGCFNDFGNQILKGMNKAYVKTNSPRRCFNICLHLGYKYSGVENRDGCLCGNDPPNLQLAVDESECSTICSGDPREKCGAGWRMGVYAIDLESLDDANVKSKYVGCFGEYTNGTRLMIYRQDFPNTLTNEICTRHCRLRGFSYAGMQFGRECYCDNNIPSYHNYADEEDCSKTCEGNGDQKCGNNFRISMFHTGNPGSPTESDEGKYLGCYTDQENSRRLDGYVKHFQNELTIFRCTGLCHSLGYLYSGTQNSKECYCGDEHPKPEWNVKDSECSSPCSGNAQKMCGGNLRNAIRETGIKDIHANNKYLGCYDDLNNQILKGFKRAYKKNNTPRRCFNICLHLGFRYYGVEFGEECFCGNEPPAASLLVSESECNMACSGNSSETCGSVWRINVYKIHDESDDDTDLKYIGCVKEYANGTRLMTGYHEVFPGTLTNNKCFKICREKGFVYAGTEYGVECFCDNKTTIASYQNYADEEDCNMKCQGNNVVSCGGDWRISLFHTGISDTPTDKHFVKYLGCYKNERSSGQLNQLSRNFGSELSLLKCTGFCYSMGFLYTGTRNSSDCFCTDDPPSLNLKVAEAECSKPCSGDPNEVCGGEHRNSMRETGIPDVPVNAKTYLGCFDHYETRFLEGWKKALKKTNSPRRCFNICWQLGFKYSGVEFGEDCFCGNDSPPPNLLVSDEYCNQMCSGDSLETCGAQWRTSVHIIDFESTVQPLISSQGISTTSQTVDSCQKSETTVNGRKTCKGDVIFAHEFNNQLGSKWNHEVLIPDNPDNEFVVFLDDPKNCYISKNNLVIKPTIYDDEHIQNGSLELKGCTGKLGSRECGYHAFSYAILPPVASARINTKKSFSFRYGIVEIRAKLPSGDWLVPELWLEPKDHVLGRNYYTTGRIRLAMCRGNQQLQCGSLLGSNRLESGVMLGPENDVRSHAVQSTVSNSWRDQFHTFTLIWKPDGISFKTDNDTLQELIPQGKTLCESIGFPSDQCAMWGSQSKIAPFNTDFYISLGLSAGNSRDFPDYCINRGNRKPWRNFELKAMLKFWQDKHNWFSTWSEEKSALYVEYVRVTAL